MTVTIIDFVRIVTLVGLMDAGLQQITIGFEVERNSVSLTGFMIIPLPGPPFRNYLRGARAVV